MSALRELLARAVNRGASDVHLTAGRPASFRVHTVLEDDTTEPLTAADIQAMLDGILPRHLQARFMEEHEADFSYSEEGVGRFRVNAFWSYGEPSMALRYVKPQVPSFEELRLPPVLKELALAPRGIIVLAGTTGSGKSTTLAALIEQINHNQKRRIITIEDPVEYLLFDDLSVISQREVGIDTLSFHNALTHVLRQNPDVIMIGEMRNAESFQAALMAAETGHLVFTSLHADNAGQAIPRILHFYPPEERDQIRLSLVNNLRAIICQRLVPSLIGGLAPAVEVMINTPTCRKLIERNLLEKIPAAIETGNEDGMQTFNQALYKMIQEEVITQEDGLRFATNPESLKMNLRGIFLDEARRILSTT